MSSVHPAVNLAVLHHNLAADGDAQKLHSRRLPKLNELLPDHRSDKGGDNVELVPYLDLGICVGTLDGYLESVHVDTRYLILNGCANRGEIGADRARAGAFLGSRAQHGVQKDHSAQVENPHEDQDEQRCSHRKFDQALTAFTPCNTVSSRFHGFSVQNFPLVDTVTLGIFSTEAH